MSDCRYDEAQDFLMRELRLMTAPIAIKYFFDQKELDAFRAEVSYYTPVKAITFCQAEIGARMENLAVLIEKEKLGCSNARFIFGWKPLDEAEAKSHIKYCQDLDQARRFVEGKPRLPENTLLAVAVTPLAQAPPASDIMHLYCDTMQAYHILGDWMASTDVHPFRPSLSINSAACGGNVASYLSGQANLFLACSGSYNSGKTERGEINVAIPFAHLPGILKRMQKRIDEQGGVAITRLGNPFPGADICKNCPLINFKKAN